MLRRIGREYAEECVELEHLIPAARDESSGKADDGAGPAEAIDEKAS
jgi:hypothetical protein